MSASSSLVLRVERQNHGRPWPSLELPGWAFFSHIWLHFGTEFWSTKLHVILSLSVHTSVPGGRCFQRSKNSSGTPALTLMAGSLFTQPFTMTIISDFGVIFLPRVAIQKPGETSVTLLALNSMFTKLGLRLSLKTWRSGTQPRLASNQTVQCSQSTTWQLCSPIFSRKGRTVVLLLRSKETRL